MLRRSRPGGEAGIMHFLIFTREETEAQTPGQSHTAAWKKYKDAA